MQAWEAPQAITAIAFALWPSLRGCKVSQYKALMVGFPESQKRRYVEALDRARSGDQAMRLVAAFTFGEDWEVQRP